jgi:hypothetical protein
MGRVFIDVIRWHKESGRTASLNANIAGDTQSIPAVGDTVIVADRTMNRRVAPLRVERRTFYLSNESPLYVQLFCTRADAKK